MEHMKYVIAWNEQQMNNNNKKEEKKKQERITVKIPTTATETAKNPYNFNRFRFYLFICVSFFFLSFFYLLQRRIYIFVLLFFAAAKEDFPIRMQWKTHKNNKQSQIQEIENEK